MNNIKVGLRVVHKTAEFKGKRYFGYINYKSKSLTNGKLLFNIIFVDPTDNQTHVITLEQEILNKYWNLILKAFPDE